MSKIEFKECSACRCSVPIDFFSKGESRCYLCDLNHCKCGWSFENGESCRNPIHKIKTMKAIEFLKSKGTLHEGNTAFNIKFPDGRQCDVVELLEEFKKDRFTVEEFRNYLHSQDSMGDMVYYLNAENIVKANTIPENENL